MTVYKGFSQKSNQPVTLANRFANPFENSEDVSSPDQEAVQPDYALSLRKFPVKKQTISEEALNDEIEQRIKVRMEETEQTIQNRLNETEEQIQKLLDDAQKKSEDILKNSEAFLEQEKAEAFKNIDDELDAYKKDEQEKIQKELDDMRASMQSTVDAEKDDIMAKAYDESYQKARADVEEQLKGQSQELLQAINGLETYKQDIIGKEKDDVIKLAIKATEVMTQRQLELSEDSFDDIIKEALNKVTDKDKVVIKVAKKDVSRVRKNIDKYLDFMPDIKSLEVHQDPHQTAGGCVIETKLGYVDASLDLKLESLEKAILDTLQTDNPDVYQNLESVKESDAESADNSLDAEAEA